MQENLVIVESPAKAKTLQKFLGGNFVVKSSFGHIRDLAKKDLGIDIDANFAPSYEISEDKKKVVAELAKAVKSAKAVWLASDEDREGEAIAWHLTQVLGLDVVSTRRIVFHEITKKAILEAVEHPRTIDMNLVDAQQARRILDRLVGFELSPVLWKKVKPSLSAGRVQSVAVRLIVEREREIIGFGSKPYFSVSGQFHAAGDDSKSLFKALLSRRFDDKAQAQAFLERCRGAEYTLLKLEQKPSTRYPAAPFTTSTLQQEASRKLGLGVSQTMSLAQRLYEAGHITYMRTDSVNLAGSAVAAAKAEIVRQFGEKYSEPRAYKTKTKGAQEAHEAIRPTDIAAVSIDGTPQEKRLYDLIWKRTVASQMASAQIEKTVATIGISTSAEQFTATGEVIRFDGFLKLYSESTDDDGEQGEEGMLPAMSEGGKLVNCEITATERSTQPPSRYSEASLVKRLEELGIGRPSTYAPTISTIITRGYVVKQNKEGVKREYVQLRLVDGRIGEKVSSENVGREKNRLSPTDIGMLVNDYLEGQFSGIIDYNFTANVEKEFDEIAEGGKKWQDMIRSFYFPFHTTVEQALEATPVQKGGQVRVLGTDPVTGRDVSARIGRYGPMVQIEAPEGEKPRYASMRKGQLIASITLEEALELFSLPRVAGVIDGKEAVIGIGKFGPYVRYDGKFTSLEKSDDPYSITIERVAELLKAKEAAGGGKKVIRDFTEEPSMQVLNGRYGPYIAFNGKNYKIPKGTDPATLSLDDCRTIVSKATR